MVAVLAVLVSGLIAGVAVGASAASAITEGQLTWGVKESFRSYIVGSIAHGSITVSEGATRSGDELAADVVFPVVSGSFDEETKTTEIQFGGRVVFSGHGGTLYLDIANLRAVVSSQGAMLYADVFSKDLESGEVAVENDVPFAAMDYESGTYSFDDDSGISSWSDVPATLTSGGAPAFAGYYVPGQVLDAVNFSYTGAGAVPPVEVEEWTEPSTSLYEEAARIADPDGTQWRALGTHDGLLWAYSLPTTARPSTLVRSFDAETLAPAGEVTTLSGLSTSVGNAAFDTKTGTILLARNNAAESPVHVLTPSGDGALTVETLPLDGAALTNVARGKWQFNTAEANGVLYSFYADKLYRIARGGGGAWTVTTHDFTAFRSQTLPDPAGMKSQLFYQSNPVVTGDGRVLLTPASATIQLPSYTIAPGPAQPVYVMDLAAVADATVADPLAGATAIPGSEIVRTSPGADQSWTHNVGTPDGGAFVLMATSPGIFLKIGLDDNGELVVDGKQSVLNSPVAPQNLSQRNVSPDGQNIVLPYQFDGQLALRILRDGKVIDEAAVQHILGIALIFPVFGPDGDLYYNGSWPTGVTDGNLTRLAVAAVSPDFVEQPQATAVDIGSGATTGRATFSVDVTGDPAPGLRWQTRAPGATSIRDWADVDDATSAEVTVEATAADNGRQYRAVASNDAGSLASDSVTLTVNTFPTLAAQPRDETVTEGSDASYSATAAGFPAPKVSWQRRVEGFWRGIDPEDENFAIQEEGGVSTLVVKDANTEQSGTLFRARVSNSVGTVHSRTAKLTVNPRVTIPAEGMTLEGVSLDWTGSQELQSAPPFGGSNYFSAGKSDGDEASYQATDGSVKVLQVSSAGAESAASYATRAAHVSNGGSQLVRLSEGEAKVKPDGSASVAWDGSWSVNFYGGLVPFTITDPELEVDKDGKGTLTADLSGYASSMENPEIKTPLAPVKDVTIATFTDVQIDPAGKVTVDPNYAGVELDVPEGQTPQNRTNTGWGSWPQVFVDFHFATGLSSYWYSSGGAADGKKPPAPFVVDFTDAEQTDGPSVTAPVITDQPLTQSVLIGADVSLSVTATGDDLAFRWQKRVGSLWIDIPDEGNDTLKLTGVVAEDAGQYRVRVSNSAGNVVSATAVLTLAKHASKLSIGAPSSTVYGKAATVTVTVPDRTGKVTLTGAGAARTVTLAGGKATFTLPKTLKAGGYTLGASYAGDTTNAGVSASRKLTVKRAAVSFKTLKVTKKPTRSKAGKATMTLRSSTGAVATGKVTVTVKKGKTTKRVTVNVKNGKATVKLPKLAKGKWKLTAVYKQSPNFTKATAKTRTVKITR